MPLIDIVIATHNRPAPLVQALGSVLQQTFSDWECWISEDGSNPETARTIRGFLKDHRFHHVTGPHSGGPSAPRNRAMRLGSAPLIAFLDDDDVWLPEKLALQHAYMHANGSCVLIGSNALRWNGHGDPFCAQATYFPEQPTRTVAMASILRANPLIASSVLARRLQIERAGLYDESLRGVEDYALWLRMACLGNIAVLSNVLLVYRDTPHSSLRGVHDSRLQKHALAAVMESALGTINGAPTPATGDIRALYEAARRGRIMEAHTTHSDDTPAWRSTVARRARSTAKAIINKPLSWAGLEVAPRASKADLARTRLLAAAATSLQAAQVQANLCPATADHPLECIAFSKDRAMQLEALIASYEHFATPCIPITVLWDASSPAHLDSYKKLQIQLSTKKFLRFVHQGTSFRESFIRLLRDLRAPQVLFLIDDVVITRPMDLSITQHFLSTSCIVSYRMGKNITHCGTTPVPTPQPDMLELSDLPRDWIAWRWADGISDWSYPLSVYGHVFSCWEFRELAKNCDFNAPNSLESSLQVFQPWFVPRAGVSPASSCLFHMPHNRVQNEFANPHGTIHQDAFLMAWQDGMRIDWEALQGFTNHALHQDHPIQLVRR